MIRPEGLGKGGSHRSPLTLRSVIFAPWPGQSLLPEMPSPLSKSYPSTKTELRSSLLPSPSLPFSLHSWPRVAGRQHACHVLCGLEPASPG